MLETHLNDLRENCAGTDLCSLLLLMLVCMTRPSDCVRSDIFGNDWLSSHTPHAYDTVLYRSFSKELQQSSRPNTGIRKKCSGLVLQRLEGSWSGFPRCMPLPSQDLPSTNTLPKSVSGARAGSGRNCVAFGSTLTDSKAVRCRCLGCHFTPVPGRGLRSSVPQHHAVLGCYMSQRS